MRGVWGELKIADFGDIFNFHLYLGARRRWEKLLFWNPKLWCVRGKWGCISKFSRAEGAQKAKIKTFLMGLYWFCLVNHRFNTFLRAEGAPEKILLFWNPKLWFLKGEWGCIFEIFGRRRRTKGKNWIIFLFLYWFCLVNHRFNIFLRAEGAPKKILADLTYQISLWHNSCIDRIGTRLLVRTGQEFIWLHQYSHCQERILIEITDLISNCSNLHQWRTSHNVNETCNCINHSKSCMAQLGLSRGV